MRSVRFLLNICRGGAARNQCAPGSLYAWLCRLAANLSGRAARAGAAAAAALSILLALSLSAAQAAPSAVFPDKYGAIVVDANSNRVLFADNADLRRYPASLTKMMTLYLLFEGMKSGRVSANSAIPISAYANGQPPTKLNLGIGRHIGAQDAAKALITKSANDIAVAIAEYLGGSESRFVRMMNLKARQLGMHNTHFANASGLPNPQNYSTARDLAILALALRRDCPQQYALFRTTSFVHDGRLIRGHNRLVANMPGVDGLKTGYTRMSGFNLASSRQMGGKSIVAVVMGGKTSALRDSLMAGLLTRYMDRGSSRRSFNAPRQAPMLMAAADAPQPRIGSKAPGTVAALAGLISGDIPIPTAKISVNDTGSIPEAEPAMIAQSAVDESDGGAVPIPRPAPRDDGGRDGLTGGRDNRSHSAAAPISAAPDSDNNSRLNETQIDDRERDSIMLAMLASQPAEPAGTAAAAAIDNAAQTAAPAAASAGHNGEVDKIITASLPAPQSRSRAAAKPAAVKKPAARSWAIQIPAGRSAREAQRAAHKITPAVRRYNHRAAAATEKSARRGGTVYSIRYSGFASKAAARQSCARLKKGGHKCAVIAP